ncbi:LuxR C-terminal-related transcriptional regulator [Bifidobacterium jacchi]|uniref:DNA-binding response regulator n=1 Tax=Bifidobacterium jacchi TaxID=2490545 RepID=A0A5N5RLF7_9BIFI|nr:response regulator transcription factor [Bifidobacterium jacchi]KAB5608128.1 DNA-binding response regulator [Bifidobacterium jacchi]
MINDQQYNYSIGVLDNDSLVLPILEHALYTRFGTNTTIWTVTNGIDAIDKCTSIDTKPDVLLCDMSLEGISGTETAKSIHQNNDALSIIGITSFSLHAYYKQAIACGMQALVKKSDVVAVCNTVDKLLHTGIPEPGFDNPTEAHIRLSREAQSLALLLTRKEALIIEQVTHGMSNQDIADQMEISINTVKTHLKHICLKLGARDRTQAAVIWVKGYKNEYNQG